MFDSPWHWIVVIVVAFVLFFGWKQLPDMSRSLGRSLRIFKTEIKGMSQDDKARDAAQDAADAQPRQLEAGAAPQSGPLPRADMVKRPRPTPGGAAPRPVEPRSTGGQ